MKNITPGDSIQRDSLIAHFRQTYPQKLTIGDQTYIVMIVLNTEPDFDRRCETVSLLRHEYEEKNISLESMLTYLRDTYRRRFGKELEIPTGTTERERLAMYARELSGCW